MPTATLQEVASLGGVSISNLIRRVNTGQIGHEPTLNAALSATLTTRTDNTSGVLTMEDSNHGIENTDLFDLHWLNGSTPQCAYGCNAANVSGNSVEFSGAAGDVLPTEDNTVNACAVSTVDTDFDGDLVEMIVIGSDVQAHITFRDSGGTVIAAETLAANEGWAWASNQGVANPLTGNAVAEALISCGNATNGGTMKIGILYDSQ